MAGNARFYVSPRDTDSTMPISPSSIIRLVPPEEKNGRLMPVLGMVLVTTAIFIPVFCISVYYMINVSCLLSAI